jgi:uncharacterized protein
MQSLEQELRAIEADKEGSYDKRTEHLDDDGLGIFVNRLIREDSPYLLQHAHNPVNWYPWGPEAFEHAEKENKPIFLSIGYSTCHWCHVMEVESFDNVEIAKLLNESFICIKMDREQYPDIDETYMTGVQIMSGHGGWPMSNFLLSDGKPFFAATYFPPPTFMKLLQQISQAWTGKYSELETSATQISEAIDRILSERKQAASLDDNIRDQVSQALFQKEDRSAGGLAGAPKFPQEPLLLFMLDRVIRNRDKNAVGFATRSLDAMGRGGIYDQAAGGFHRYSVDAEWLVPHFEKMLYNQSQLGLAYLQAYRLTGNEFFKRICKQTLDYVLRDMQLPEGGFYSATDADSEGAEGVFFLWTIAELNEVLSTDEAKFIVDVYGLSEYGNFEGSNILNLSLPFTDYENQFGASFSEDLDRILLKLYQVREERMHPLRDDKLIVAWASAMISTLAQAGSYYKNAQWVGAAEKAAQLIRKNNVTNTGKLNRIYLNNTTSIEGQLEDYVNYVEALINLFDITASAQYLENADVLMRTCLDEFWDSEQQGFFLSPINQIGPQLTRSRSASDGATISAVSTALACLISLRDRSALLKSDKKGNNENNKENDNEDTVASDEFYRTKCERCINSLLGDINDNAVSHTSMLRQLVSFEEGSTSLIQYVDGGLAKVQVEQSIANDLNAKTITLNLTIADGWHVTAPQASNGEGGEEYKELTLGVSKNENHWLSRSIEYPESGNSIASIEGEKVAIYETAATIKLELERTQLPADESSFSAEIYCELQLCNDKNCLLPKTLSFRL